MGARFLKSVDSLLGPLACQVLARVKAAKSPLLPEGRSLRDFTDKSILVIRPGGMGDAVLLLPALVGLKNAFPDCGIDVLCEKRNEPVFVMSGVVRETICYDRAPLRALRALRRGRWPVVADTEQFHHASAAMAAMTAAPVCIGFAMNPARQGMYERTVAYDTAGREIEQFARIVRAAAGADFPIPRLAGVLSRRHLPDLDSVLRKFGAPDWIKSGKYITLHIGASDWRKRWAPQRNFELAAAIRARFGLGCILVGDASDAALAFPDDSSDSGGYSDSGDSGDSGGTGGTAVADARGCLSLGETASLIANAVLHVGPDSGLAHVAVAVGVRPVVLFGPADPGKWGPPEGFGTAVTAPTPCAPCAMFGTMKRCRTASCMDGISVSSVLDAVEKNLHGV